jgi:hypothetical protein
MYTEKAANMTRNLILTLLLAAGSGQAGSLTVFYNNTITDSGFTDGFAVNNLVEAGDQITLDNGAGALAMRARTALYNSAAVSGTADVTLRIYSVDGTTLGSQLLSSTLTDVTFDANSTTFLTFSNLSTNVPGQLIWTLSYGTTAAIAPELRAYDAPSAGSSDKTTVWWDDGSGLKLATPGFDTENYYFSLDNLATPEPGAPILMCTGVALLAMLRRRCP